MSWIEVREPTTKKLLFKYDPARDLIEIRRRGTDTLVDLAQIRAEEVGKKNNEIARRVYDS